MKEKHRVIYQLMQRHIDPKPTDQVVPLESCRQKIFSTFHNLTENDEVCKDLGVSEFINWTNQMFVKTIDRTFVSGNIHELAIKSLINICQHADMQEGEDTHAD